MNEERRTGGSDPGLPPRLRLEIIVWNPTSPCKTMLDQFGKFATEIVKSGIFRLKYLKKMLKTDQVWFHI